MKPGRERVEELWTRRLTGETLSGAEEAELLQALSSDAALRRELLDDEEIHRTLDAAGRTRRDAEAFARSFLRRVAADRDATRFLKKLDSRIRPTAGRRRRRARPRDPQIRLFPALLAAGGFLLAITLLWIARPADEPPRPHGIARSPVPPPPLSPVEEDDLPPIAAPLPAPSPEPPPPPAPVEPSAPPPSPAPVPAPPKPVPPPAPAPSPPPRETQVAVLTIEEAHGDVRAGDAPARSGSDLPEGRPLRTGASPARAAVRFLDGTRLELGPLTTLDTIVLRGGKRVALRRGSLRAQVASQPPGEPMVFVTPQAEATVLGTTLRLAVEEGRRRETLLEVEDGRVRLKRLADGRTVDVPSGHFAVAAVGGRLVARPIERLELLFEDPFTRPALDPRWSVSGEFRPTPAGGALRIELSHAGSDWRSGRLFLREPLGPGRDVAFEAEAFADRLDPNLVLQVQLASGFRDGLPVGPLLRYRLRGATEALEAYPFTELQRQGQILWQGQDAFVPGRFRRVAIEADALQVRLALDGRTVFEGPHGIRDFHPAVPALEANLKQGQARRYDVRFDNLRLRLGPERK